MAENKPVDQMAADDWRALGNFTFNLNREQVVARMEKAEAQRDELLAVCEAAIRYDEAIRSCANDPDKMASHCTAQDEDLDALYFDWLNKAQAAIAKAKGE